MKSKLKKLLKTPLVINLAIIFTVLSVYFTAFNYKSDNYQTANVINGAYYYGNPDNGGVSLTFNVYQGTEEVYKILQTLKDFNATATFFVGGCWADDNSQVLTKIITDGHEIGSHGYYHKDHAKLSLDENLNEIRYADRLITSLTGVKPTLFAPPSGSFSKSTITACEKLGYRVIMWSADTIDWRDQDVTLIKSRAVKGLKAGNIILMHPTKATTLALGDIINTIYAQGLTTLTVSENLQGF
jgi:peptidoglycan/xylan/chitin deacetylase (PgdA/CDA1 family)